MGFSIHYRSTETMHPARAFEIKEHAKGLTASYTWLSCEPVLLDQQSDGYLLGQSKPNFLRADDDVDPAALQGLPDGNVMTMVEVLCTLSREHHINWDVGHDYEPEPIGQILNGVADSKLMEQLETFGSIGDLLDEMMGVEQEAPSHVQASDDEAVEADEDDEPRVLKFPSGK